MKSNVACVCLAVGSTLAAIQVFIDVNSPQAMEDFQYHIRRMSGKSAEIAVERHPYPVPPDSPAETFRLKSDGSRIWISGKTALAVSHGLYEALSRMGCDWVMPGELGEVIPENPNPAISECDVTSSPSFPMRFPWYSGGVRAFVGHEMADYDQWKRRHKLQTGEREDCHPLYMRGGHVWDVLVRRYRKQFEEHPDMYALVRKVDGSFVRQGPQVETTDPRVLALFEDYVRSEFTRNNWPKDKAVCIGVGPADGGGFSQSPESVAAGSGQIDPAIGAADGTDLMILLCNTLLEKLCVEFPNLHLGFYLYSWHGNFPVRYKIHPNIVIVVADISFSRLHSTLEPVSTRAYYRSVMEKWAATPNTKFYRSYNWNLAEFQLPFSKFHAWPDDLRLYHAMNTQGSCTETAASWSNLAPWNYLEAALLWDVNARPEAVLKRYCKAAYGPAADALERYFMLVTRWQSEAGEEAGGFFSFPLIYNDVFISQAEACFAEARQAACSDAERKRIELAHFPLEHLERFLKLKRLQNDFQFKEACEVLQTMIDACETRWKLGDSSVSYGASAMLKRFFQPALEAGRTYSTGENHIVFRLPDVMPVRLDPHSKGAELGFAEPRLRDDHTLRIPTYSTTWASLGIAAYNHGSIWYRTRFPAWQSKDAAGLLLTGVDGIARVWCNGRYVGMGNGFARPLPFDLTDFVKGDGENFLAIEIERRGNNEIGTGGIIYPAFVFSGPRLERRAPEESTERLLPGGAVDNSQKARPKK